MVLRWTVVLGILLLLALPVSAMVTVAQDTETIEGRRKGSRRPAARWVPRRSTRKRPD